MSKGIRFPKSELPNLIHPAKLACTHVDRDHMHALHEGSGTCTPYCLIVRRAACFQGLTGNFSISQPLNQPPLYLTTKSFKSFDCVQQDKTIVCNKTKIAAKLVAER